MARAEIKMLLVEDDPEDAILLRDYLHHAEQARFMLTHVERLEQALDSLAEEHFDIVLLDITLPDETGIRTFERVHDRVPDTPIVVLTGLDDQMLASRAVRGGAQDYLLKHQIDTPLLERSLRYAIERKQAQEALRQSEKYFRSLIENALDIITLIDERGHLYFASPSVERVLGYKPEEILGRNVLRLVHLEDLPAVREALLRGQLSPHIPQSVEFRFRHKNGDWLTLEAIGKNLLHEPTVSSIVVNSRDITERRRMEAALRESEERLRTVIASAPIVLFALDSHGMVTLLEGKGLDKLGHHSEEAVGLSVFDMRSIIPEVVDHYYRALSGEAFSAKLETGRIVFECWFTPLRNGRNEIIGVMGVATDISELKRSERALKKSRKQLRDLAAKLQLVREHERSHIAREIHDELGQALTILKLDVSWMARRLDPEQQPIREKALQMAEMIDATIGTVRRISTELRPGILDDLGVTAALEWQAQEFQSRTGIECTFSRRPLEIDLDPERSTALFRIFQEILTNVARHANADRVEIAFEKRHGHLVLAVADNGRGMNREDLIGSKSLGLVGMQERALALGGDIRFRSRAGKGTQVMVKIPMDSLPKLEEAQ